MKNVKINKSIYKIVKKNIDKWDPMFLLCIGSPKDEYDGESYRISELLNFNMKPEDIANIIINELNESFGEEYSQEECIRVSKIISKQIKQYKSMNFKRR